MTIKNYLFLLITIIGFQYAVNAQENSETFTIYLVRHSEKGTSTSTPKDPPLSPCGKQRAEHLNNFLKNVPIDAIYSTNYTRTKSTAIPTSISKGLKTKLYNPRELNDFSNELIDRKENALVVGHSNTTGVLAGLIADQNIGAFEDHIYNRVYKIVIRNDTKQLEVIQTDFTCND